MSMIKQVLSDFREQQAQRIQAADAAEPTAVWRTTGSDDHLVYCNTTGYQYSMSHEMYRQAMEGQPMIELHSSLYDAQPLITN